MNPTSGGGGSTHVATDPPAERVGDLPVHRHRGLDPAGPDARPGLPAGVAASTGGCCARTLAATDGAELLTEGDSFFLAFARRGGGADRLPDRSAGAGRPRLADPGGRAPGPDGPAHRLRRAARRRVRQPRGAPGGPGRRRRARRAGALLGGHRAPRRTAAARARPCSTSACTGCAASTTGNGCSSSSPPGWSGSSRDRAPPTRSAHNLPDPGHLVRRAGRRERAELQPAGAASTGWSRCVGAGGAGQDPARGRAGRRRGRGVPGRGLVRRRRRGDRPGAGRVRHRRRARAAAGAGPADAGHPGRVRGRPPDADRAGHLRRPAGRLRGGRSPGCCPAAAGVRVLATSREPFGLPGEVVWRIPPLSVDPPPDGGAERRGGAAAGPHGGGPGRPAAGPGRVGRPAAGRAAAGRAAARHRAGRRPAARALGRAARRAPRRRARHARRRPGRPEPPPAERGWSRRPAGHRRPGRPRPGPPPPRRAGPCSGRRPSGTLRCRRPSPGRTGRWARGPPGCCAGCRSSPARWTWRRSSGCSSDDPLDPLSVLVDKSMVQAEPHAAGQHLPDARPDPGVRRPPAGRGRRGAGRPRPARRLVAARAAAGVPGPGRPAGHPVAVRARPARRRAARRAALDAPPGAAPGRGCGSPAGSTSGGASAGWPGRGGSGCSGSTGGSPRPASGSRTRSWRRRTTCTRCTPARTASSPRSCASRSGPRRRPGRPATPGCWPGCSPAGRRR